MPRHNSGWRWLFHPPVATTSAGVVAPRSVIGTFPPCKNSPRPPPHDPGFWQQTHLRCCSGRAVARLTSHRRRRASPSFLSSCPWSLVVSNLACRTLHRIAGSLAVCSLKFADQIEVHTIEACYLNRTKQMSQSVAHCFE